MLGIQRQDTPSAVRDKLSHRFGELPFVEVRTREQFVEVRRDPVWDRWGNLEHEIRHQHAKSKQFHVVAYSVAAGRSVPLRVDAEINAMPNWREGLICPVSGLNNRMRAVIWFLKSLVATHGPTTPASVYLTEQVTATYRWCQQSLTDLQVVGSEWLGPDLESGLVRNGIRHEDIQRLSFSNDVFDFIVSQDVMEHVPDPWKGFEELARVLKPGGCLLLSIPFYDNCDHSRSRARLVNGKIQHLDSPQFHGDPLNTKNGSLVFSDFGWDVLERLLIAGFRDAHIRVYWSYELGHLGQSQILFVATK